MADEQKPKYELTDIRPDKVSIVDLGANAQMFFIAKRARDLAGQVAESENSIEAEEREEMAKKIAEMIQNAKKAAEATFEFDSDVTKQLSSANAKLSSVLAQFNIDSVEAKDMDNWDLRYKLGEVLDILIRAAKLEDMLGQEETVTQNAEETTQSQEAQSQETQAQAPQEGTEKKTEPATSEQTEKTAEKESETLKSLLMEALAPLTEKVTEIAKRLDDTEAKVEKAFSAREVAHGGSTDETNAVQKNAPKSVFSSIMPSQLRSK